MKPSRIRIGIVGLQPGQRWAARAHLPALRALSDTYDVVGVANSNLASSEAAATATGIPRAFANAAELIASSEIDVVTVTVRVPYHFEIVKSALEAGKAVFCEWPLGNGLAEAVELAALARAKGLPGIVGTQAYAAPEVEYLKQLVSEGFVGEVLSTTLTGWGAGWGGAISEEKKDGYLLDAVNGATLLTIPLSHTLAALQYALGKVAEVSSVIDTRRKSARALDTGNLLPMSAPDQILACGHLANGVPLVIHYRGGMPRGDRGLLWEVNGTEGDLRIFGPFGHSQLVQLALEGARSDEKAFRPLEAPASLREGWPSDPAPGNVARVYARMAQDLREGTHSAPNFDDAVALHRLVAAIERSAETGIRTEIASIG